MVSPQATLAIDYVMHTLGLCCAFLRWFVSRRRGQTNFRHTASHIILVFACLTEFASTSAFIPAINVEINARNAKLSPDQIEKAVGNPIVFRNTLIAHDLYYVAVCAIKASYLLFYAELFTRTNTKRIFVLYGATFVWAASYIAAFLCLFLLCRPFKENWNPSTTNPNCPFVFVPRNFAILSSINIVSDVAILFAPLFVISSLQLARSERISLVLVFSVGGSSIVASIVRFVIIYKRFSKHEYTWETVHLFSIWSHTEVFFGVLAFTLPVLRYFMLDTIQRFSEWLDLSVTRSGTRGSRSGTRSGLATIGSARKNPRKASKGVFTDNVYADNSLQSYRDRTESQVELTEFENESRSEAIPAEWSQHTTSSSKDGEKSVNAVDVVGNGRDPTSPATAIRR